MPDGMGCMQMPASRAMREARYPFEPVDRAAVRDQTRVRSKPSSPSSPSSHQANHCPSRPQSKRASKPPIETAKLHRQQRSSVDACRSRNGGMSASRCRRQRKAMLETWSVAAKCGAGSLNARFGGRRQRSDARNLNARAVVVGMQCQALERTICSAVVRVMVVVVRLVGSRACSLSKRPLTNHVLRSNLRHFQAATLSSFWHSRNLAQPFYRPPVSSLAAWILEFLTFSGDGLLTCDALGRIGPIQTGSVQPTSCISHRRCTVPHATLAAAI